LSDEIDEVHRLASKVDICQPFSLKIQTDPLPNEEVAWNNPLETLHFSQFSSIGCCESGNFENKVVDPTLIFSPVEKISLIETQTK
jgi:hypothetical protein